jgi:hypothetical protein
MSPRRILSLLALVSLVACGDKDGDDSGADGTDGEDCSAEAVASVAVTVEPADVSIAELSNLVVEFAADGEDFAACSDFGDGSGRYSCGYEVPGAITVRASADGYAPAEETVEVGEDACHVITEQVTLTLVPEPGDAG